MKSLCIYKINQLVKCKYLVFNLVLFSFILLYSLNIYAGGYYLPDRGVRAYSRGGAFVVGNNDLSALWYNPATLASQHGTRFHTDFALIDFSMEFQKHKIEEVGKVYNKVSNEAPPLPDPSLAISSDFGFDSLVFALGVYGPYSSKSQYPHNGAQRYSLIRDDNLAYFIEFAGGWEPFKGLRLGTGLVLSSIKVSSTQSASTYPGLFGGPEDRDLDADVQYMAEDDFSPSIVMGIWFAPGEWISFLKGIEFGFSYMPETQFKARGKMRIKLPDHVYYDNVEMSPEEPAVLASFSFPKILRGGIRYKSSDNFFDIEFDIVKEYWSCFDFVDIKPVDPTYYKDIPALGDFPLLPMSVERNFKDSVSYRLGGSLRPLSWLVLRLGGYYEKGTAPDEYLSVAAADLNKWSIGTGFGFIFSYVELDIGYMHVFQQDKEVKAGSSKVLQINPSNQEDAVAQGAGKYLSSYNIIGVSLLFGTKK